MATQFVVTIDCKSSSFGSPADDKFGEEVARILRHAADLVEQGYTCSYLTDSEGRPAGFAGFQRG